MKKEKTKTRSLHELSNIIETNLELKKSLEFHEQHLEEHIRVQNILSKMSKKKANK